MKSTLKQFGIDKLSPKERLTLAQELWDSIELDDKEYELSPEWKSELDKRSLQAELHPELGQPWEVVKARLLKNRKHKR